MGLGHFGGVEILSRAFILFVSKYFHIVSRFSSLFLTMICKYFFKIPLDN